MFFLELGVCAIQEAMTCDRFCYIFSILHINDNAKLDKKDKIYKVRPLVEALNDSFRDIRASSQHLSIDESMIHLKDRTNQKGL